MLASINKKDLAERSKKMRVVAQTPSTLVVAQYLKLKVVVNATQPLPMRRRPTLGRSSKGGERQLNLLSNVSHTGVLPLSRLLHQAHHDLVTW